jgi:hypothetical protein
LGNACRCMLHLLRIFLITFRYLSDILSVLYFKISLQSILQNLHAI